MTDAQLARGKKLEAEIERLYELMKHLGSCEMVNVRFSKRTGSGIRYQASMELSMEEIHVFRNALTPVAHRKEKEFEEL